MAVTIEVVRRVAHLARLRFSAEEEARLAQDLNQILEYAENLNGLDTERAVPTSHVLPIQNVFREDVVTPSFTQEEILANAPSKWRGFFRIPKVIE